jgi:hypothetical protein
MSNSDSAKKMLNDHNGVTKDVHIYTCTCDMDMRKDIHIQSSLYSFRKKWWVESDFKAPNLPLSLRFKGSHSKKLPSVDTEMCCPKGKCGYQYFIFLT